jgi:hypothetical protein
MQVIIINSQKGGSGKTSGGHGMKSPHEKTGHPVVRPPLVEGLGLRLRSV